ncbi:MAG: integron integrase [Opitutaceae bacterium]|nr:integron integrase [Opitutaceae bacterium]
MNSNQAGQNRDKLILCFPNWTAALAAAALEPAAKEGYRREILAFLHHCKIHHAGASIILAKAYLSVAETQGRSGARAALRWWFRAAGSAGRSRGKCDEQGAEDRRGAFPGDGSAAGARQGGASEAWSRPGAAPGASDGGAVGTGAARLDGVGGRRTFSAVKGGDAPLPAAHDLGESDWERDLINACRERHFLWRTEETYWMWGARFARFLAPRSPYVAEAADLAAFLSRLAVEERASVSAQKQALNALVFLMQEALHRQLAEIDFPRAQARKRIPTVLSPDECDRFFAQLTGTPRLMTELAYGAGLRLMELIRLRVHHLDLDRLQLQVRGGKGDKDRITVLPVSLVEPLREHLERLRVLFEQDRAEERPGVWLPEGLARKYPNAGTSWEWQWLFPSRKLSVDPVSGLVRRHHVQDGAVQSFVRRAARAARIDKRVTPHVLRHSFGTHMIENGYDIRTVQELMGHDSVETTMIYLHVVQKGLGAVSPLDKLKGLTPPPNPGLKHPNWPIPPTGSDSSAPTH